MDILMHFFKNIYLYVDPVPQRELQWPLADIIYCLASEACSQPPSYKQSLYLAADRLGLY